MSAIMISLQMIRDKHPCTDGWRKVKEANKHRDMDELFPMSNTLDSNDLSDTLWATRCIDNQDKMFRKFAWWCVKQALKYTDDKRVSDCLDVVEKYIDGNATIEELREARRAADAAADAAYAAADAADAADAARKEARRVQAEKLRQILTAGKWVD